MNLVFYLTIGAIFSVILGEFGHFPFGGSAVAISVTDIFISISLIFLLIWQIGIKHKFIVPVIFKYLVLFWLVGTFSLIFSGNLYGGLYLIRFIIYSSSLWLGYSLCISGKSKEGILKAIIYSGLILSLIGFLQLFFYPDLSPLVSFGFDPHKNRLVSSFLDPNFLGAFLVIPFIFCLDYFRAGKKRFYMVFAFFILIAIVLTFSRSAYLMLLVSISIYGLRNMRKILFSFLILSLLLYLFIPTIHSRVNGAFSVDASSSQRIQSWQNGLYEFGRHPLLGVGFDNLRSAFEADNKFKVFSENGGHSGAGVDSSIIFILATSGILGFLSFAIFFVSYFIKSRKGEYSFVILCLFLGLLIDSSFINSLFYSPILFIFFLIMGLNLGQNA